MHLKNIKLLQFILITGLINFFVMSYGFGGGNEDTGLPDEDHKNTSKSTSSGRDEIQQSLYDAIISLNTGLLNGLLLDLRESANPPHPDHINSVYQEAYAVIESTLKNNTNPETEGRTRNILFTMGQTIGYYNFFGNNLPDTSH